MRSQKRTETLVESGVDCITSSYGVGPTDENGRPLFGLRALRRTNTNKQLATDEVEVKKEKEPEEPVCDARGRPLFGGLKALRALDTDDMPEQNASTQLRELVQRHEKVVRETNGPQEVPRQKPKAKLRDSFILQEEDQSNQSHLSEVNSLNRGLSLRSIIQKHEGIAATGGVVRNEMESSHTTITSKSTMSSDGTVSLSRDIVQGEISAKNGEEPTGKVTRTQYTYQSPQGDDKGVNKVTTTTTTLGGRRTSGPRITEVEEIQDSPQRKSSLKSSVKRSSVTEVTDEVSSRKSTDKVLRKGSLQKSVSDDEDSPRKDRRFSSQEEDEEVQKVTSSRISSAGQKFTSSSTSSRQTESRTKTSSPSLRRQRSSEEESSAEEKRKTVVRGDSVRALQHKFQQATENAANSAPRSQARAGLILRTSSFTTADNKDAVSSTLKQSTNLPADKKSGRQSPDKSRRESPVSDSTSKTSDIATRRESLTKSSSDASRRESLTQSSSESTMTTRVTETSSATSFLDNTTRVTGVQDILTRMRNADLVTESGDSDADREARALLNKFLGASVILQGMEQGMRSGDTSSVPDGTPGSAALVSSVEKQRQATTRQKEEDIETIWDEEVLKSLLEQCTDYDGRRKLRARLRTVMAEHKACADLVAVTGNGVGNASQHAGECVSPSSGVDDSGTESGEDFRLLSPEILAEVQSALIRLESALPGLDPTRREALVRLVTRLQTCLKLQPPPSQAPLPTHPNPPLPQPPVRHFANRRQRQQRHTVGVSKEELADARRWLLETGQPTTSASPLESVSIESQSSMNLNQLQEQKPVTQVFRPVKFTPNPKTDNEAPREVTLVRPPPFDTSGSAENDQVVLSAALTFPRELSSAGDSGSSLLEYDPSLALFTPAQSVQIAVHKAAINKQISEEESKREHNKREESYDSDDGDISSAEEEQGLTSGQILEEAISSAQRLLQFATDKKTATPSRFHARHNKKQKMKRANTIDIPKPANYEMENSSDEFGSANEASGDRNLIYKGIIDKKVPPPLFQPKTQSDLKFLAFLQQANKNEVSGTYNPSARGGKPWTNRFVNIKTAFEAPADVKPPPQNKTFSPSVAQNWQTNATKTDEIPALRQAVQNRSPQPLQNKQLSWNPKKEEEGVVIGSLTVKTSPGPQNKFSHAQKSAFKPIEKRPIGQPQKITIEPNKPVILPEPNQGKRVNQLVQKNTKNSVQQVVNGKVTTSVSGTVKQLATQKFSGESTPSKPIIKQYPVIQDKQFNAVKPPPFVDQVPKSTSDNSPVQASHQFPSSIASARKQFSKKPEPDTPKVIKVPQKTHDKEYKDATDYSPPKPYINSPPLNRQYSDSLEYPIEQRIPISIVSGHQSNYVEQNALPRYSQEVSHQQHSTYVYSPKDLPLQPSSHVKHVQPQYNGQENHFSSGITNISSSKFQTNTGQVSTPYSQHRFGEESLVPNPLVLGEVYKPVPPDYLPFQPPSVPRRYETSLIVPINEPFPVTSPVKPTTPSSSGSVYDNLPLSKPSDLSPTLKQYLNIPNEFGRGISPVLSNQSKSPYFDERVDSSGAPSPAWNQEDLEDAEVSLSEGMEMQTAVSKVMGQSQCQKAVTVSHRTKHRYEDDRAESADSLLRTLLKSPNSPTNLTRKQSFENKTTITENRQPSKSPLIDKSARNKVLPDTYSYPVVAKPPAVSPQNESKLVSAASSAFRPLVNNLSNRLPPPVPSIPPSYGYKQESDRLAAPSTKFSTSNTSSSSSRHYESELLTKAHTSSPCRSPSSSSPSFPNVLQKSESWHQLVKEQMAQGRHPPPKSPRLAKTKSSHSLAFPKQFEAHLPPETVADKQTKVNQYLKPSSKQTVKTTKQTSKQKKTVAIALDDSLDNVDEAFESLFQEVAKRK